MKKYKFSVLLSFLVIFLPMATGLVLWNKLPDQIATHWNFEGQADSYSSKLFAVVGIPLFLAALQTVCLIATKFDRSNKEQNKKVLALMIWIVPFISVLAGATILSAALGTFSFLPALPFVLVGIMFIVIGNYMPKCKQNRTIGLKIKWTLDNEENWNATHRFAGKLWVIGGTVMLCFIFLPPSWAPWLMLGSILTMTIIPVCYSYHFYKTKRDGIQ